MQNFKENLFNIDNYSQIFNFNNIAFNYLIIYDALNDYKVIKELQFESKLNIFDFSKNNKYLFCVRRDKSILIYNCDKAFSQVKNINILTQKIIDICICKDNKYFIALSSNNILNIYDSENNFEKVKEIHYNEKFIKNMIINSENNLIIISKNSATAYDINKKFEIINEIDEIYSTEFSPTYKYLLTNRGVSIDIFDTSQNFKVIATLVINDKEPYFISFSNTENYLIVKKDNITIYDFSNYSLKKVCELNHINNSLNLQNVSLSENYFICKNKNGRLIIYDFKKLLNNEKSNLIVYDSNNISKSFKNEGCLYNSDEIKNMIEQGIKYEIKPTYKTVEKENLKNKTVQSKYKFEKETENKESVINEIFENRSIEMELAEFKVKENNQTIKQEGLKNDSIIEEIIEFKDNEQEYKSNKQFSDRILIKPDFTEYQEIEHDENYISQMIKQKLNTERSNNVALVDLDIEKDDFLDMLKINEISVDCSNHDLVFSDRNNNIDNNIKNLEEGKSDTINFVNCSENKQPQKMHYINNPSKNMENRNIVKKKKSNNNMTTFYKDRQTDINRYNFLVPAASNKLIFFNKHINNLK